MSCDLKIMEDCSFLKLKRKDLEEFSDDFSDFSLTSPARKIRRLDAELPPIVEEEESETPFVYERSIADEFKSDTGVKIEEISSEPSNEERAIVLFNSNNAASTSFISSSPSSFNISVSPQILAGFKNHVLLPRKSSILTQEDDEEADSDDGSKCLAVIPWSPPSQQLPLVSEVVGNSDMMDAQEDDDLGAEEAMDVEDNITYSNQSNTVLFGDAFHQWQQQQQQHCLVPQPPQNSNSQIVWYR